MQIDVALAGGRKVSTVPSVFVADAVCSWLPVAIVTGWSCIASREQLEVEGEVEDRN